MGQPPKPDTEVAWQGRPHERRQLTPVDFVLMAGGAAFLGLAIMFLVDAVSTRSVQSAVAVALILPVAMFFVWFRIPLNRRRRRGTRYRIDASGVTMVRGRKQRSRGINTVADVQVHETQDGRASLLLLKDGSSRRERARADYIRRGQDYIPWDLSVTGAEHPPAALWDIEDWQAAVETLRRLSGGAVR